MQKRLFTDPILDAISIAAPWRLVETFSTMPRWRPKDVNKGAEVIVKMLKDSGVPVTVHKPTVYLSIPFGAEVRMSGRAIKAKPPAYSRDCRQGIEGELVHVPATYSKSVGTLFAKNFAKKEEAGSLSRPERIGGKIVISEGFGFPGKMLEFEQNGAIGAIAVNPGADIHWGIATYFESGSQQRPAITMLMRDPITPGTNTIGVSDELNVSQVLPSPCI